MADAIGTVPRLVDSIEAATHRYTHRGIAMVKNPFDLALYAKLLWDLKPRTIIEIGSWDGGSALWFRHQTILNGARAEVYSVDVKRVVDQPYGPVFIVGDANSLELVFSKNFFENEVVRPLLVVDDGSHNRDDIVAVLRFFHPHLRCGDYVVVEDGRTASDAAHGGGPKAALAEFLATCGDGYEIDRTYCDFFGENATWNMDGWLKRL